MARIDLRIIPAVSRVRANSPGIESLWLDWMHFGIIWASSWIVPLSPKPLWLVVLLMRPYNVSYKVSYIVKSRCYKIFPLLPRSYATFELAALWVFVEPGMAWQYKSQQNNAESQDKVNKCDAMVSIDSSRPTPLSWSLTVTSDCMMYSLWKTRSNISNRLNTEQVDNAILLQINK